MWYNGGKRNRNISGCLELAPHEVRIAFRFLLASKRIMMWGRFAPVCSAFAEPTGVGQSPTTRTQCATRRRAPQTHSKAQKGSQGRGTNGTFVVETRVFPLSVVAVGSHGQLLSSAFLGGASPSPTWCLCKLQSPRQIPFYHSLSPERSSPWT